MTRRPVSSATSRTAASGGAATARAAKQGASATAKAAGATVTETAKSARAGAKGTATAAKAGAKETRTRAKAANTAAKRETVTLTRGRIQETLDEAASHGRVTRKDANDLVAELMRHGRQAGDEVREEVGELLGKGADRIQSVRKKVRKAEPVDRIVRGADRARRAAGVGPTFPIIGYDDLNVAQVQVRIKELSRPDQRKVLTYERKHANRKSIVGPLEKALA